MSNATAKKVKIINAFPMFLHSFMLTKAIGMKARVVETNGIRVKKLNENFAILDLPSHPRVHNHIGGIAAASAILNAETASALVMAMNIQDNCVPVLKSVFVSSLRE